MASERAFRGILSFRAVILAGAQVPELLHLAAGPFDHHAVYFVASPEPERHGELGLRHVARPRLHHARLRRVRRRDPNDRADAIAVRLGSLEAKAKRSIARSQI